MGSVSKSRSSAVASRTASCAPLSSRGRVDGASSSNEGVGKFCSVKLAWILFTEAEIVSASCWIRVLDWLDIILEDKCFTPSLSFQLDKGDVGLLISQ